MSTPSFNYFKEKLVLREEEKSLKEMLAKFQDQLNRLKIEELALLSHIKMQEEEEKEKFAAASRGDNRESSGSGLTKGQTQVKKTGGPSSEGGSSVSSAVPVGVMYYESPNKAGEELDLAVKSRSSHQGYGLDQDLGDEEEEEEEEEEDNDDENPLYSFMDTV